jgi:tetratricopeptide (TPR) repeat protein
MTFWQKMKKAISAAMAGIFLLGSPATKSLEGMLSPKTAYAEEDVSGLLSEGSQLIMTKKYDDAEKLYLEILKKEPRNYEAHNNLGLVYWKLNKPNEAIKEYKTAVNINPEQYNAFLNFGNFYRLSIKSYELAIENYQKTLKLKPSESVKATVYYGLGISYKELGRYKEAITYFDEYLKNENDKEVRALKVECEQLLQTLSKR